MNIETTASHRQYVPPFLAAQPATARLSAVDEQALIARLAACRSELLAIALLDPAAHGVVERMAADVERRKLRVTAVVDLLGGSPQTARERFGAFREALAALGAGGAPEVAEAALEERLALVRALPLSWDGTEQVLEHTWVRARDPHGPRLPPSACRRVRSLQCEIERAIQRLVAAHRGLVAMVARRYRGLGLCREDLIQEGTIGLLRAVEKFDAGRGSPFGAYAVLWVRQAVRRALANQSRTIRVPSTALAARYTLGRASIRLTHELGREPSEHELARATGATPESVADFASRMREPVSLDAPRGEDSSSTVGDRISDPDARSPTDHAVAMDSAARLHELLGALPPREQLVLELRFGLRGEEEQTLEAIGRSLELTRERVRQIVAQALQRLHRKTCEEQIEL